MIHTPSANIEHAAQKLKDIKGEMRKALLRLRETQKPPRIGWVGSHIFIFVILFHCVPVTTKIQ